VAIPGIKAGAIRFDARGRILIDRAVQAEVGSYTLPSWAGGTSAGADLSCPSPDVGCVPETVCADVGCVPESACADVGCVPEGNCADVSCVPESACADAGCVPEGACADAGCVPEGACADVACVPEGACADVACVPEGACADGKCIDIFCSERNKGCPTNMECAPPPDAPVETEGL
jgi:hypothetical protein